MRMSFDESYKKPALDPLPDRLQGRKIVVSPKVEDDKGLFVFCCCCFFCHGTLHGC